MRRFNSAAAGALLLLVSGAAANGQQSIQWKQTINTPKSLNLPSDVKGDILGIELGDTYDEVKLKLNKLIAEAKPPEQTQGRPDTRPQIGSLPNIDLGYSRPSSEPAPQIEERTIQFRMNAPGGYITASYVGGMSVTRRLKGSTSQDILDIIELRLSAPSSGQQMLGIGRTVMYGNPGDQPRLGELLAQLKDKYKAPLQTVYRQGSISKFRMQFNDGKGYVPKVVNTLSCPAQYGINSSPDVPMINRTGDCDVVLEIDIEHGMSDEHVKKVAFVLSDNERTKANVGADFAFFDSYVRNLQARPTGAAPKL